MQSFLMPAVLVIRRPVSTPPVKVTRRTRGSATRASPSSSPRPVTTFSLPGRKSRVHQVACEAQRGERRRRAGLQHHGVPARQRRPDLVAGHRERVVERRDRPDHADREPEVIAHPVFGTGPAVEGQRLAGEPPPLLRRQAKQRDAPDRLTARFADRLAPFEGNRARVALDVRFDARRRARQRLVAGMGGPRPVDRLRGGRHRGGDVAGAPARHGVDQPAVEGIRHVDGLLTANPLTVDQHPRPAAVAGPWPAAVITGHSPLHSPRHLTRSPGRHPPPSAGRAPGPTAPSASSVRALSSSPRATSSRGTPLPPRA